MSINPDRACAHEDFEAVVEVNRLTNVPIRPASSDPDFGIGMPGFAVRFRDA